MYKYDMKQFNACITHVNRDWRVCMDYGCRKLWAICLYIFPW